MPYSPQKFNCIPGIKMLDIMFYPGISNHVLLAFFWGVDRRECIVDILFHDLSAPSLKL